MRKRGENIRRAAFGGGFGRVVDPDPGSVRVGRILGRFTSGATSAVTAGVSFSGAA
jgi:hypothetical protein